MSPEPTDVITSKLGSLITGHVVCPIELGFRISAHIIQILGRVEKMRIISFLACEVK